MAEARLAALGAAAIAFRSHSGTQAANGVASSERAQLSTFVLFAAIFGQLSGRLSEPPAREQELSSLRKILPELRIGMPLYKAGPVRRAISPSARSIDSRAATRGRRTSGRRELGGARAASGRAGTVHSPLPARVSLPLGARLGGGRCGGGGGGGGAIQLALAADARHLSVRVWKFNLLARTEASLSESKQRAEICNNAREELGLASLLTLTVVWPT